MELTSEVVEREVTPLGELVLLRVRTSDGEEGYEILLDGAFLMGSHGSHSERELARLGWSRLAPPRAGLRVLVGGLGAGHTLRAALDLPGVTLVTVAEIGARVLAWNRRYLTRFNGAAVDDARVRVTVADVREVLAGAPAGYELVLLDVDNGPGWLAAPGNAALYRREGIQLCRRALAAGGVLAVWSPAPNPVFAEALAALFPAVETVTTTAAARAAGEPPAVVYLARRGASADRYQ